MPNRAEVEAWDEGEDSDDTIRGPSVKWSEGLRKSSPPPLKGRSAKEIEEEGGNSPDKSDARGLGLSFYHDGKKTTTFFPFSPEQKRLDEGEAVAAIYERVLHEPEPPRLDSASREKAKAVEARILAQRRAHQVQDEGKAVFAIDERLLHEPEPPRLDSASREKAKAVEAGILAKRRAHQAPAPAPAPLLNTKPITLKRILKPSAPPNGNYATLNPLKPRALQPLKPPKPRALQRIMADHFKHSNPIAPRPRTPPSPHLLLIYEGEFYSPPADELLNRLLTDNLRSQVETLERSSRSCSGSIGQRSAFPGTPNLPARSASAPVSGNPFGSLTLRHPHPSSGSATARTSNTNGNGNATAATIETPTHHPQPLTARNLAALRAIHSPESLQSPESPQSSPIVRSAPLRSLSGPFGVAFVPYLAQEGSGPLSPATFGQRVFSFPIDATDEEILAISRSPSVAIPSEARGPFYFTEDEREALDAVVKSNLGDCAGRHRNCTACLDTEYAYYELRVMPASLSLEERQRIINDNRSLRNIKNELESLLENGTISDEVYDTIMSSLPTETPLNGAASRSNAAPASVPTNSFNSMRISDPPPPAYNNPTPPTLPSRQPSQPPPKPELARVVALYRYTEPEDCTFEVGDTLSVQDYMNAEWWFGTNLRTGREGVFPVNYVKVLVQDSYNDEKASGFGGQAVAPALGPSSPYDTSVPPMGVANQQVGPPSKGQENAKKFGKKLGNAAVFGAGATLGGKLVNSIF